jgi:stage IV sporulation protein B
VTELTGVDTADGAASPSKQAGLQPGDRITHVGAAEINGAKALRDAVNRSGGRAVTLRVERADSRLSLTLTPAKAADNTYKIGALIRDCVAGIGTVTFCDPATGLFGALGHGIGDNENSLIPFEGGDVYGAAVQEIARGAAGKPGELRGAFVSDESIGRLYANTEHGVFGRLVGESLWAGRDPIPVAAAAEVRCGPASVLANVQGDEVRAFAIEIVKIYGPDIPNSRHFMLKVVDPELLDLTAGIVQGMSGSPILQNGKLVGAVTHVLVGDPKRGYGLFLEHMFKSAQAYLPQEEAGALRKVS